MLEVACIVSTWGNPTSRPVSVEEEVRWVGEAMRNICDASMPRVRHRSAVRNVYWWSAEIAQLRTSCVAARRQYTRYRRRRGRPRPDPEEEARYGEYRAARTRLQEAIATAKAGAREELLRSIDRDPWGRPYQLVRGKLRPRAPPLTRCMRPELLSRVVETLFPDRTEHHLPPMVIEMEDAPDGEPVTEVTREELRAAVIRLRSKNTAPGPDGIPGRALAYALSVHDFESRLRGLMSACLEQGQFPLQWRSGRLVLLRKEGRPAESPSAYRPIVLLDELGKLYERVLAARLSRHLEMVGPNLSENQFGFRKGRSTLNAIMRVKGLTEEAISRGEVVLAVSLDIANAFNTLPWRCIKEALRFHRVPLYLRRVIEEYLNERSVTFDTSSGQRRRAMSCGVPQGSVLGPLLWNVGYDWVLRGETLRHVCVVCYADDTLVTAAAKTYGEACRLATAGVAHVVARMRRLGLEVALEKSEALCFHGARRRPPPDLRLTVGGVSIGVGSTLKYLGLVLDSRWSFAAHFRQLAPKVMGAAGALAQLLPNLGGPDTSARRLYMGVIKSMALYGAPVWAEALTGQNSATLRRAQRAMAVRVIRGYRTVSYEAACVLAGSLPWDLEAKALALLFRWREEALQRGMRPALREVSHKRTELRQALAAEWGERLADATSGHVTILAIQPVLSQWLDRRHGSLSFRATQVLSGHGCFGEYLCRIGREPTRECHHCDCTTDTAEHTLAECPAWESPRRALVSVVGDDLSLPAVVRAIVDGDRAWDAFKAFCEAVMAVKEEAERVREVTTDLPMRQRRNRRRGRRRDDLYPP